MKEVADNEDIHSMLSYAKMCFSGERVIQNMKEAIIYNKM